MLFSPVHCIILELVMDTLYMYTCLKQGGPHLALLVMQAVPSCYLFIISLIPRNVILSVRSSGIENKENHAVQKMLRLQGKIDSRLFFRKLHLVNTDRPSQLCMPRRQNKERCHCCFSSNENISIS